MIKFNIYHQWLNAGDFSSSLVNGKRKVSAYSRNLTNTID